MLPIEVSLTVPAASATGIATAQTLGAAGNFTLNGSYVTSGVAYMPSGVARRVLLTFAADETGHNFTIYGTSRSGAPQSETLSGTTAGTVYTHLDFLTITRAASDAATTGNVSIGTNGIASTRWVYVTPHVTPFDWSFASSVSGTVNYTLQRCYKDPAGHPYDFPATGPLDVPVYDDATVASKTDAETTSYSAPFTAWRVTMNSGNGTVNAVGIQSGITQGG